MRKLFFTIFIAALLLYSCKEEKLSPQQECEKTIRDTFENASEYEEVSIHGFENANISLDSFRRVSTVLPYVVVVCKNEKYIADLEYKQQNGISCGSDTLSCEEVIALGMDLLLRQREVLERKEKDYTETNYIIIHEFNRYGWFNRHRYFLNDSYHIIAKDYLIDQGLEIKRTHYSCDD